MTSDTFQRKLTAILSADVVGYSRLMGDNEEATVRTLNKYKKIIFDLIERHNGRLVDSSGDNVLAEFVSVVDAVRCGVQIQEDLKVSNEELPTHRRMDFRIGINTGDVIQDGDRIYGDGVNVAARIESLVDAGGICLSRTSYDQVKKKLKYEYEYLGEYEVKNIDEPVRVYRIQMEPEVKTGIVEEKKAFTLSEKPSIAVLPFDNLSPEKDQKYFVDGLTEEILNYISNISGLHVTSKTSSFAFKKTDKTIQEIAEILGRDYILEGSVRKAGNSLRITAQLIHVADDRHIWSEAYNRELKDIFKIQEEIANSVAHKLKLTLESIKLLGGTENIEAYELYLNAKGKRDEVNIPGYKSALELLDAAIVLDPEFALAWAYKAHNYIMLHIYGTYTRAIGEVDSAQKSAEKAIEFEPNLADGYIYLGHINMNKGEWLEAELNCRKALELTDESLSGDDYFIIPFYLSVGKFKKANELLEKMRRNDPIHQVIAGWYYLTYGFLGDRQRAEDEYQGRNKLFIKAYSWWHDDVITLVRLGSGDVISRDEIVSSDPINIKVKESLDSPEEGLLELRRIYSSEENLSSMDLQWISIWAAHFGDSEFALEVIKKSASINAEIILNLWYPVMREIRQTPRFKEYVREIGLVDYWKQYGWPDICRPLDNGDFECD